MFTFSFFKNVLSLVLLFFYFILRVETIRIASKNKGETVEMVTTGKEMNTKKIQIQNKG